MTQLSEEQLRTMADTFRLMANSIDAYDRGTCLDRHVMLCWNWVVDALNDIPEDVTAENGLIYRLKKGQMPKLKNEESDDIL